jgi:hypothetical protein
MPLLPIATRYKWNGRWKGTKEVEQESLLAKKKGYIRAENQGKIHEGYGRCSKEVWKPEGYDTSTRITLMMWKRDGGSDDEGIRMREGERKQKKRWEMSMYMRARSEVAR